MMETVKVFANGKSQAVRLPKKFRFDAEEVLAQRIGHAVVLVPKERAWNTFLDGINGFTDDFFADGRENMMPAERDSL